MPAVLELLFEEHDFSVLIERISMLNKVAVQDGETLAQVRTHIGKVTALQQDLAAKRATQATQLDELQSTQADMESRMQATAAEYKRLKKQVVVLEEAARREREAAKARAQAKAAGSVVREVRAVREVREVRHRPSQGLSSLSTARTPTSTIGALPVQAGGATKARISWLLGALRRWLWSPAAYGARDTAPDSEAPTIWLDRQQRHELLLCPPRRHRRRHLRRYLRRRRADHRLRGQLGQRSRGRLSSPLRDPPRWGRCGQPLLRAAGFGLRWCLPAAEASRRWRTSSEAGERRLGRESVLLATTVAAVFLGVVSVFIAIQVARSGFGAVLAVGIVVVLGGAIAAGKLLLDHVLADGFEREACGRHSEAERASERTPGYVVGVQRVLPRRECGGVSRRRSGGCVRR